MQAACAPAGTACAEWQPVVVDPDDLAGAHVAHDVGADEVERARLGGDDPVVADPAERERPDPVRVAERDERLVRDRDDRVRALEPRASRAATASGSGAGSRREQRGDHLGVGASRRAGRRRRAARRGARRSSTRLPLCPSATVRAAPVVDERLRVLPVRAPGGRVARVPDRDLAGQRRELLLVEDLRRRAPSRAAR